MIHIWFGGAGHESAGKLGAWLSMKGAQTNLAGRQEYLPSTTTRDLVVVWGRKLPGSYLNTLNLNAPYGNKLRELFDLTAAGLPMPGLSTIMNQGWLSRKIQHHDGDDLTAQGPGDFYVEPVLTTYEFRVNVFKGQVFRTGLKIPKPGVPQSVVQSSVGALPIRTGKGGWTWTYSQAPLDATGTHRGPMREIAVKAVKTLRYDFGAVDIGYRPDGRWVVFEVNSAPALEGDDLGRYGQLILDHNTGVINGSN